MEQANHTEWNSWQEVCKEFRKVCGEVNNKEYNKLFHILNIWAENLGILRKYQPEGTAQESIKREFEMMEDGK